METALSPTDLKMEISEELVEIIIGLFNEQLKIHHRGGFDGNGFIMLVIEDSNLTIKERYQVELRFKTVGWINVKYKTSLEGGERAGLASLTLEKPLFQR